MRSTSNYDSLMSIPKSYLHEASKALNKEEIPRLIDIVFSDSACGSLKVAQHIDNNFFNRRC